MTRRHHRPRPPYLDVVGPTMRALPHAAGLHEWRSAPLAAVAPVASRPMRRVAAVVVLALSLVGSALVGRTLLAPPPVVEVRPTWTDAAGWSTEREPPATRFGQP